MAEWSREVGLPRKCLEMRLNDLHWSIEKSLTTPWKERMPVGRPITFNGITKPMTQWAADLGLTERCLENRLGTLKWPLEKVLTTPNKRPKRRS